MAAISKRVIFSKWLNKRPKILILDEPTRGVDIGAKREIGNLITSLASEGTATLLITSEVEEMVQLCRSRSDIARRRPSPMRSKVGKMLARAALMAMALGEEWIDA